MLFRSRGYRWQMFHTDRNGPELLAGVRHHSACTDVIVLSGADVAHAYRLPADPDTDVFAPARVHWWYAASPVWTLRALLTLPAPGDPGAPRTLHPAPPGAGIPVTVRRTT